MPGRESSSTVSGGRLLTRRAVIIGGAATAAAAALGGLLVEEGVLPGRRRLERLLGQAPPAGTIPDTEPGPVIDGSFESKARGQPTGWAVSYPPGSSAGSALPVLISLHGKGGDHTSSFDLLGLHRFLADHVSRGGRPFAIAAVDAGDTYYHPRDDGSDSGAMVADELVPLLGERGLDTTRLGLFGVSMGGYGSLYLTSSGQVRPRAVGTLSAALWTRYEDSAPGAFDDAADFAEHDVFRMRPRLAGVPLRMDCGTDDPFVDANREFVAGVEPAPAGAFEPGHHDVDYWTRLIPDHLDFIGRHLTA